jgi:hypothetical protein
MNYTVPLFLVQYTFCHLHLSTIIIIAQQCYNASAQPVIKLDPY